jgi:hypothetical protein
VTWKSHEGAMERRKDEESIKSFFALASYLCLFVAQENFAASGDFDGW